MPRKKSKAPNGAGVIEKREGVKGRATRYLVRYYVTEADGTRKQKSKSFRTYGEADKFLVEVKVAFNSVPTTAKKASCGLTVGQWMDTWVNNYLVHLKPRTMESYKGHAQHDIIPALGDILLTELTPDDVQRFYNSLADERGLSPKSIRNIHGALNVALNKAVQVGHMLTNPAKACTLPRRRAREMTVLDDDASKAFLSAVQGHRYEAIYVVDLFTGLRKGELLGLTWDCVDFRRNAIVVRRQLNYVMDKSGYRHFVIDTPKNDHARTLVVPSFVMQILLDQKAKQDLMKEAAGSAWEPFKGYDLVFTNELGRYLLPSSVYRQYKKIVASIGLSDMRLHDLRHSYAVAALKGGDDYKTLQENLGHASSSFTLDVYGHSTDEMKRRSAARMEQHILSLIDQNSVSNA